MPRGVFPRRRAQKSKSALQTRQKAVTRAQSLVLVKNLLRTAVYTIAYLRGIFPEECFADKKFKDITIKTLTPRTKTACKLMNWLESGVFDALSKEYLDETALIIRNARGEFIESYRFKVRYTSTSTSRDARGAGEAVLSIEQKNALGSEKISFSRIQLENAAVGLVRKLIMLVKSLDVLPESRTITMSLLYNDERTPDTYEPKMFKPENNVLQLMKDLKKTHIHVGSISTPHHAFDVKVGTASDGSDAMDMSDE